MRQYFILLIAIPFYVNAQNRECTPHRGFTSVCDSVYKLCRIDAYYLTMISVSKPTSLWYDSLYYPEELMFNYTNAMCALYNDLPDSLADFRAYHYDLHPGMKFHPDSSFIISIDIPLEARDRENVQSTQSGNRRIDSILRAGGLLLLRADVLASLDLRVQYRCPPKVNRAFLERKLHTVHPLITITPVYKYCPYRHIIEADEGPDRYSIILMESYKCMPPELPCQFIKRTFWYQQEWGTRYGKFERGIVPWPDLCVE